jgi:hypothetical protein
MLVFEGPLIPLRLCGRITLPKLNVGSSILLARFVCR